MSHETAHAVDRGGRFSNTSLYNTARSDFYRPEISNPKDYSLSPYFYYYSEESFAESFGRFYGRDRTLKKDWPRQYEYMSNFIKYLKSDGK